MVSRFRCYSCKPIFVKYLLSCFLVCAYLSLHKLRLSCLEIHCLRSRVIRDTSQASGFWVWGEGRGVDGLGI